MMLFIQDYMAQQNLNEGISFTSAFLCMSNSIINLFTCNMSTSWVLGSGATSHMANSLSMFNSYSSLSSRFVILPNKSKVQVMDITPDYSLFKVFSCLTYVGTIPTLRTEFDPR